MAILLFSCTLALHARQVNIKLRLDYLWTAQARDLISHTECLPSVESALRSGDKCHLVTVSNFSMYRWILLARILLRTFASVFIGDIAV
ncbi:uncharacterized protein LOC119877092 isoform X1 [Canis lupus familiaris]|nr:uncharacterized protein LOC119877092 isoform X1 [Canis lupus familiaris]